MVRTRVIMVMMIKLFLSGMLFGAGAEVAAVYSKLPVKEVTVFKDGHAFVLHEGEVAPDAAGDIVLDELPQPIMGSFWTYSVDPDNPVQCVIASRDEVKDQVRVSNLNQLFRANLDKQLLIKENVYQESYPAEIVKILSDQNILVKTREGVKTVHMNNIQSVTFLDTPEYSLEGTTTKELLRVKLKNPAKAQAGKDNIGMAYVQLGLRWIPSYRIEIDGNGKAMIKLQATIVNELTDLENVKANLVVGVPSFAFKDTPDPISFRDTIARMAGAFDISNSNRTSNMFSNAIQSQVSTYNFEADMRSNIANPGPQIQGSDQSEDMYIFSFDNLTLKKGQRMVVPIAEYELEYTDIYTLDISFQPPLEMSRNFNSNQHLQLAKEFYSPKAVHKIRLDNTSKYPLTTAPAMILKDGKVLSQGMMKYTAPGSSGDLEFTTAVNINVKYEDKQTSRKNNAVKWEDNQFSEIAMAGEVYIKNYSEKTVKIFVKRSVLGNIDKVEDNGEFRQLGQSYGGLAFEDGLPFWWGWCNWPWWWYHFNSIGIASWEVELEPGKDITLNYKWHYYWN